VKGVVPEYISQHFVRCLMACRFGEEAVQRMVDFVEEGVETGLFKDRPTVLDVGELVVYDTGLQERAPISQ
jgi:hypothetical protein